MSEQDMTPHAIVVSVPTMLYAPADVEKAERDRRYYLQAARNIRYQAARGNAFLGSNVTETVAKLCEAAAHALGAAIAWALHEHNKVLRNEPRVRDAISDTDTSNIIDVVARFETMADERPNQSDGSAS